MRVWHYIAIQTQLFFSIKNENQHNVHQEKWYIYTYREGILKSLSEKMVIITE